MNTKFNQRRMMRTMDTQSTPRHRRPVKKQTLRVEIETTPNRLNTLGIVLMALAIGAAVLWIASH